LLENFSEKTIVRNTVYMTMTIGVSRVVEFSDDPAGMILYEGVFFRRSQAESYLIAHSHSIRHDNMLHHHKCITAQLSVHLYMYHCERLVIFA